MNDNEKYGPEGERATRWARVVRALDDYAPKWRKELWHIGDDAVAAIGCFAEREKNALAGREADRGQIERQRAEIERLRVDYAKLCAELEQLRRQRAEVAARDTRWERSYTKDVCDMLAESGSTPAIELLKDYHATRHELYERAERAEAHANRAKESAEDDDERAAAWGEVWGVLRQHNPAFCSTVGSGLQNAVKEIRRLQALDDRNSKPFTGYCEAVKPSTNGWTAPAPDYREAATAHVIALCQRGHWSVAEKIILHYGLAIANVPTLQLPALCNDLRLAVAILSKK